MPFKCGILDFFILYKVAQTGHLLEMKDGWNYGTIFTFQKGKAGAMFQQGNFYSSGLLLNHWLKLFHCSPTVGHFQSPSSGELVWLHYDAPVLNFYVGQGLYGIFLLFWRFYVLTFTLLQSLWWQRCSSSGVAWKPMAKVEKNQIGVGLLYCASHCTYDASLFYGAASFLTFLTFSWVPLYLYWMEYLFMYNVWKWVTCVGLTSIILFF